MGNPLLTTAAITDDTVITVHTHFGLWADGRATFDGDLNDDKVLDGLAWLIGAESPDQYARGLLPAAADGGTHMIMSFRTLNATERGSAQFRLQSYTSLEGADPWAAHTVPDVSGTVNGVVFLITPLLGTDLVQVQASVPVTGDRVFTRLNALLPPP